MRGRGRDIWPKGHAHRNRPLSPLPTGRRKFIQRCEWLIAGSCFPGHLRFGPDLIVRIPIILSANLLRGPSMHLYFPDT